MTHARTDFCSLNGSQSELFAYRLLFLFTEHDF